MRIVVMDEKETAFYKRIKNFLVVKMGFDDTTPIIKLNSGDNSVVMRGDMAGYSLAEMKEYIAKVEGKKVEWENEDY